MKETSSFEYGTGLMGTTEPGQKVTKSNIHFLPPGSVVRNGDGSRIIHLHDNLWLWCDSNAWCYDDVNRMKRYLDKGSTVCHLATEVDHDTD